MSEDYTSQRISDMEGAFSGHFKRVRAELGVESFGISVIELPPDFDAYPEHDHLKDGQEEIYVALAGSGQVEIDGSMRLELDAEPIVRVGPTHRGRVLACGEGLRVLTVGGTPGRAYRAPVFSELGAPGLRSARGTSPRAGERLARHLLTYPQPVLFPQLEHV